MGAQTPKSHRSTVQQNHASTDSTVAPPAVTYPANPTTLSDVEGAVNAGWREYNFDGKVVYVNDSTYEEAGNLEKVQKLMAKARDREARGIKATGTVGASMQGALEP